MLVVYRFLGEILPVEYMHFVNASERLLGLCRDGFLKQIPKQTKQIWEYCFESVSLLLFRIVLITSVIYAIVNMSFNLRNFK